MLLIFFTFITSIHIPHNTMAKCLLQKFYKLKHFPLAIVEKHYCRQLQRVKKSEKVRNTYNILRT